MDLPQSISFPRANTSYLPLPLALGKINAGFPSPADDYIELGIDLNEQLIQHPASTFFLRVSGNSMIELGVHDGDLLIIDRSLEAKPGKIVIAVLDGEFTLKQLAYDNGIFYLKAANPNYPKINLQNYSDIQIWGVAIYSIHNLTATSKSIWP